MNDCHDVVVPALEDTLEEYSIEKEGNYCRVTTPFRHSNGDLITLWVRSQQGDKISVRDRGETFAMLRLYGVDPAAPSRTDRLEQISHQFDATVKDSEIKIVGQREQLGELIQNLIQATLATSHLIYTHQSQPPTEFKTKVDSYLYDSGYDYETEFEVVGSATERTFDFSINSRSPEVLLDTVHSRTGPYLTQQVEHVMLNWHEVREKDYDHGVVVDDVESDFEKEDVEDLKKNLDYFFEWSERQEILDAIPVTA